MSSLEVLRKAKRKVSECAISTGIVYVKSLGSVERASYMASVTKGSVPPMHEIAALGLCDEDGAPCYDLTKEDSRQALEKDKVEIDGTDWEKIAMKLFQVSGLTKESKEESEKN